MLHNFKQNPIHPIKKKKKANRTPCLVFLFLKPNLVFGFLFFFQKKIWTLTTVFTSSFFKSKLTNQIATRIDSFFSYKIKLNIKFGLFFFFFDNWFFFYKPNLVSGFDYNQTEYHVQFVRFTSFFLQTDYFFLVNWIWCPVLTTIKSNLMFSFVLSN